MVVNLVLLLTIEACLIHHSIIALRFAPQNIMAARVVSNVFHREYALALSKSCGCLNAKLLPQINLIYIDSILAMP